MDGLWNLSISQLVERLVSKWNRSCNPSTTENDIIGDLGNEIDHIINPLINRDMIQLNESVNQSKSKERFHHSNRSINQSMN